MIDDEIVHFLPENGGMLHAVPNVRDIGQSTPDRAQVTCEPCLSGIAQDIPESLRIPVGTRVRCIQEDGALDAEVGREYLIENYVPANKGDAEPPEPYYALSAAPGQGGWWTSDAAAMHRALRVTLSAELQVEALRLPSPEEIVKLVSSGMHGGEEDGLEIYETSLLTKAPEDKVEVGFEGEHDYEYGVEFYGRRSDGRGFGGIIRLTSYWPTDD